MSSLVLPTNDGQEGNYKNALNALLQRITGKSMGKEDIRYDVVQHGGIGYQCTCTIGCLDGQQASGEVKTSEKEAEQQAAFQAILALEQDLTSMGYSITDRVLDVPPSVMQAVMGSGLMTAGQDVAEVLSDQAIKTLVHAVVTKASGKELEKGSISYDFAKATTPGMFHAMLKLPSLPGALGKRTWQGADSPFRRDSQLDCALKALDSILTNPAHVGMDLTTMTHVRTSAEKKAKEKATKREKNALNNPLGLGSKGGGKGKGKGKGGNKGGNPGWVWTGAPGMQNAGMEALGLPAGLMELFNSGFNFGNSAAGAGGPRTLPTQGLGKLGQKGNGKGPRKRISEEPCTGDVVVWKEKFGLIQPHFEVSHPFASKNQGKIFVNARDVEGGALFEGQSVTFFIYEDGKGLGAEAVAGF